MESFLAVLRLMRMTSIKDYSEWVPFSLLEASGYSPIAQILTSSRRKNSIVPIHTMEKCDATSGIFTFSCPQALEPRS